MSKQYPGGLITKTPVTPSGPYETSTASGIWTLDQQAYWRKLNQWPIAGSPAPDAQFNYVTMLLHGDGTNGAQNNTFVDSSTNNFTITRNGNTTQGSFSPYGSNWSNYFDGSTAYLNTSQNSAFTFDGNFTVEFWVYISSNQNGDIVGTANNAAFIGAGNSGWIISYYTSNGIRFGYQSNNSWVIDTALGMTPTVNAWNHVAVVRNGSTITGYLNGVAGSTPITNSSTFTSNLYGVYVGSGAGNQNQKLGGYVSNLRVVKGTAVYTSAFTPSTTPLTAISGTSLLTCQSNRFLDASSNAFAITVTGTPSVQRFNPFGASTAYSTSVIGGSGYFDGTSDYLTTDALVTVGTTDFTYESWVYITATSYELFYQPIANGPYITFNAAGSTWGIGQALGSINNNFGAAPTQNQWHYIAVSRSGSTINAYIDGTRVYTGSNSVNYAGGTGLRIGQGITGTYTGYTSDMRISFNYARYTSSTMTVPTTPVASDANTYLLLNMTNAGIFDNAMMNDLETVGNAQISTSVVKYGTGSLAFDGTGDYLLSAPSNDNILGSGDFTIEFWLYPSNTSSGYRALVASENYNGTTGGWSLYQNGTSVEFWITPGMTITLDATSAITASTWQHVALCRASGTLRLFVNGTSVASVSNSTSLTGQQIWIGDNNAGSYFFNGYIDDLRITKGYARYTANFTPPTQAFPNIGPT